MDSSIVSSGVGPDELKQKISSKLLYFPLTPFDAAGAFDPAIYAERIAWLGGYGPAAVFAAGGAGEFFSLTDEEYRDVVRTAVSVTHGTGMPVVAATGYGTRKACAIAEMAEQCGADGLLVLPPYLVEATQDGLFAHISAICKSTKLGIIIYNRANGQVRAETVGRLLDECPNLIGFKDGVGDVDELLRVRDLCGDRLVLINGMPTAEIFAQSFCGMGMTTYSSAIFNFVPRSAVEFHKAIGAGDTAAINDFTHNFLLPYRALCRRHSAYAVSMVKAGATLVNRSAGLVRPPLTMPTENEQIQLGQLIAKLGPQ